MPAPVDATFLRRCLGTLEYALTALQRRDPDDRDNRNETAHDYGEAFAEATLASLPAFLMDARALADRIEEPPRG